MIPTCDNTDTPPLKSVIHLTAAFLYGIMLAYHVTASINHWRSR